MECNDETPLDVLTRAATLVATGSALALNGEDGKKTSSAPGSPVDLRDSPSKELPTRSHKLKRSKERRELDYSLCKDKSKKSIPEELLRLNGPQNDSLDESNSSEVDHLASDGGDDDDDMENYDDEEEDMEGRECDDLSPDMTASMPHQGRLLVMRTAPMVAVVDDDAPLDMTTSNRSRSRDTSSPSPSPPLSLTPVVITPPFCSNPPLLYSPYASSAPPPPYHPLHYHPHPSRQMHSSRPHRASPTSPPPPYLTATLASAAAGGPSAMSTVLQQHNRPSVITCASALRTSASSPSAAHLASTASSVTMTPRAAGAVGLMRSHSSGGTKVTCNGPAASRRSLSDPNPLTAPAPVRSRGKVTDVKPGHRREIRSGMCDPVIDEHFRRSLGKDYPEYLSTSSSSPPPPPPSSISTVPSGSASSVPPAVATPSSPETTSSSSISITGMSVDDHFAKALGDTWLRIQGKLTSSTTRSSSSPVASSPSSGTTSPTVSNSNNSVKMVSSPPSPLHPRHSGMIST